MFIISLWSWLPIYIDFQELFRMKRSLACLTRYRELPFLFHPISQKVWGDSPIKSVFTFLK